MGRKRVRSMKTRVKRECCIRRGGQMTQAKQWRHKSCRSSNRKTHSVGRCKTSRRSRDAAGRTAPGVKVA